MAIITNARIGCIDGSTSAHLIKFIYSKNKLVQQELFTKKMGKYLSKLLTALKTNISPLGEIIQYLILIIIRLIFVAKY